MVKHKKKKKTWELSSIKHAFGIPSSLHNVSGSHSLSPNADRHSQVRNTLREQLRQWHCWFTFCQHERTCHAEETFSTAPTGNSDWPGPSKLTPAMRVFHVTIFRGKEEPKDWKWNGKWLRKFFLSFGFVQFGDTLVAKLNTQKRTFTKSWSSSWWVDFVRLKALSICSQIWQKYMIVGLALR